ncbi:MAG: hypothetical protein KC483_02505 [Nitrosarchaeum sp.]|nr:hypothetical protein [Nitrosarchaeum sp.]
MSTNAQVRTAWNTNVFSNFSGVSSYAYAIDPDSGVDANLGISSGIVNFWQYVVKSTEVPQLMGKNQLLFEVVVSRVIQDDLTGANHNVAIDDFRTLIDYVNDNLDTDWGGTVDKSTEFPTPGDFNVEPFKWGSTPCWRGTMTFRAEKLVNA